MHKKEDNNLLFNTLDIPFQSKQLKKKHEIEMFKAWRKKYLFRGKRLQKLLPKRFLFSAFFRNKYVARQPLVKLFNPWYSFRETKNEKKESFDFLKTQLKSELHIKFFQPWKYEIPFLTEKQDWLRTQYDKLRILPFKHRIDFFQTQLGQMMLASWAVLPKVYSLASRRVIRWEFNRQSRWHSYYNKVTPQKDTYLELRTRHQKSWFYENILRRRKPYSLVKFKLTRQSTAFHTYWIQAKIEPWIEPLFFRRAASSAFEERFRKENKMEEEKLKMKFYLRKKNPRIEKRNRLYKRKKKLLADSWHKKRIRANKAARIKQIAGKILRPFYGHLTLKQFIKIVKKRRRKKTRIMTRNEALLRHLENRLDVLVYRLNWAPHILWARRLIWEGSVFVSNIKKTEMWNIMHSNLKKYAFPLTLRDPKHLYSKTFWNPQRRMAKYKFLCAPTTEIAYLVQPGDIIQCSRGILINQFKSNSLLFDKPNLPHVLSTVYTQPQWDWSAHRMENKSFDSWQEHSEHINSAIMLFNPKFKDLPVKDRVRKSFLRWVIL
jgi:hypothetical protein